MASYEQQIIQAEQILEQYAQGEQAGVLTDMDRQQAEQVCQEYERLVREQEVANLDSVRFAPVIFQRYIEAAYDLRLTVVGGEIFPAAIYSQETS